jgi:uncharacterized membrane protein YagU involved in acid resistance
MSTATGHYLGLYIFIGVIIGVIGALVYLKLRWSAEDKAVKLGREKGIKQAKMEDAGKSK